MVEVLDRLGLEDYFSLKYSLEDFGEWIHKDNPAIFQRAIHELSGDNISPFLMFEDGKNGIIGAQKAWWKTVGILADRKPEDLPGADMYIKDFESIRVSDILTLF